MYRIWCLPPPLSVTRLPPSRTTRWLVFTTFAVAFIVMVTGLGPQLNVITPPLATALTTAAEVQLAGVPLPMTRLGWLVFTARAARGTNAWPFGLPAAGSACAAAAWVVRAAVGVGFGDGVFAVLLAAELDAVSVALCGAAVVAQAVSARAAAAAAIPAAMPRMSRVRQMLVVPLMPPWPSSRGKLARPGAQPARTLLLAGRERLHPVECEARPAWPETCPVAGPEAGEGGSVGPPDATEVAGHLGARAGD